MKMRLRKLLAILKPLVLFLMILAVMILPFLQFVYAVSYSLSDNGENEAHTIMALYSFHLLLVTSPCLYGLDLYMLRDLCKLLPDKAIFLIGGKVLRWVLRILFGMACFVLAVFVIAIGAEYLL